MTANPAAANDPALSIMQRLERVVADRLRDKPGDSYIVSLLAQGDHALASKLVEESYELVAAAGEDELDRHRMIVHEAADLLFHVLVFLGVHGVTWDEIERELQLRFGVSGLSEKRARTESPS